MKVIRIIVVLLGLAIMTLGTWIAITGYAYTDLSSPNIKVPLGRELAIFTKKQLLNIPSDTRESLKIKEHGLLYPLGGSGAIIIFIGFIVFTNGLFRKRKKVEFTAEESSSRVSEALFKTPSTDEDKKESTIFSIDEFFLDDQEPIAEKLRDINYIVTISQSDIEDEVIPVVINSFRPELEPFIPIFNSGGLKALAHQILQVIILRHTRSKDSTTADQYKALDDRINECESKTFARRYMPSKEKITSDSIKLRVGKAYDLFEQSHIQKQTQGEASDWVDVSLRNATIVLVDKTSLEDF